MDKEDIISEMVKLDLDPILNLFGAADGGVAFTVLRHTVLPEIYLRSSSDQSAESIQLIVKRFSKLCQMVLDNKL